MKKVTNYSDYILAHRHIHGLEQYQLIFWEDGIITCKDDIFKLGMANNEDEIEQLNGMSDNGIYYFHPILSIPFLTHSFIDLDVLIKHADKFNYYIPDEFRLEKVSQTKQTINKKNKEEEKESIKKIYSVSLDKQYQDDPFQLLKITPIILEFLEHDPKGIKLMELGKSTNTKEELVIATGLKTGQIENIWRVAIPPKIRSPKLVSNTYLMHDLIDIKNVLWEKDKLEIMWLREDNKQLLLDKGYSSNEALAFIALLSPQENKKSGRLNINKLKQYQKEIELINLDWTKKTTLFE